MGLIPPLGGRAECDSECSKRHRPQKARHTAVWNGYAHQTRLEIAFCQDATSTKWSKLQRMA